MKSFISLSVAFFLAAISLQAQKAEPATPSSRVAKTFRLDPRWPFVYLKFDHIGEGAQVDPHEPSMRIWLHLVNNCRLPIVVRGGQPVEDGLPGEVAIDNEVKLNPPIKGLVSFHQTESAQSKPTGDDEAFMPKGYPSFDVVSTQTIPPGEAVLFSVPVNFVTKKWHFEIRVVLDSERPDESSPEQSAFVNPNVRGHVEITLSYGFYDLPKEHQDEVEKLNRALQRKP